MRVGGHEEGMEEAGWEGEFSPYTFLFCFDLFKNFWWPCVQRKIRVYYFGKK